jgi:ribosomal protein S19
MNSKIDGKRELDKMTVIKQKIRTVVIIMNYFTLQLNVYNLSP